MKIADNVVDLIGDTPVLRLRKATADSCEVIAKLDSFNPGGSAKDRPALAMIDAAEKNGLLKPGGTIIEPTSGNTGVGLAIAAASRGYSCIFVLTDKVGEEKVNLLKAYGAKIVVCPAAVEPDDPRSYYSVAKSLAAETPNAFSPNQYHNLANPEIHFHTTGPEIWEQTRGTVTHFVAGVGTGGSITGIGKFLKSKNSEIKIVAGDPVGSVFSGGDGRPYLVEGVGEDFWPTTFDPEVVDEVIEISDAESFQTARTVTKQKGLLVGGSGGTAIAAAIRLSKSVSVDAKIVVLVPDTGRGYLSTVHNDEWIRQYGFGFADPIEGTTVGDILNKDSGSEGHLVAALPTNSVSKVISMMEATGDELIPISTGPYPFAKAEVVGHVSLTALSNIADASNSPLPVKDYIQEPLPTVGIAESADVAADALTEAPGLLVMVDGRPKHVLTRAALLNYFEPQSV